MNPVIRNILAVIAGIIIGSIVNMSLINVSGYIIPPPEGADMKTMEGLKASMHLFQPRHFIFPFLAHALGTFVGALVAGLIAATNKMKIAMVLGFLFLVGGITAVSMIPAPLWFNIADLVFAYLPMAFLAGKIAMRRTAISQV